ncbi:hypothetical protein BU14_0280s0006 [Porphyra umbilicalis]|uniref:W2 domain-containing protein n=1 Tax=Porphyra umbilicalis TaxID=2786 RepID=A0A1X6P141_PORUM|nr:hypothetical protein BU14_0280s0006 [Porphyra umbilicalis]|eukprot:OSX74589.1 hypothetical protein BU14_0280s0006 [Porphyra umbilicalis]
MAGMGGGGMKNIGGSTDQFYRYKMPGLQRKVCGRGNGIKTQLVNCAMVARALHRPAGYVCKFFGCELGAQTKIDDNTSMYIVNGAHELDVLEEILARFVRMFVLCSNCDLPETDLTVDRKGTIKQVCKACGCNAMVDMTHKLCTYIANNPPDGTAAAKAKGRKKESQKERRLRKAREAEEEDAAASKSKSRKDETPEERAARKARRAARKAAAAQSHDGSGDGDDDDEANVTGELPTVEGMTLDDAAPAGNVDPDELEWSVDTSAAAQEARMRELGSAAAILESGKTEATANGNHVEVPAPPAAPAVPALEVKQMESVPEPVSQPGPVPVAEVIKAVEDGPRKELATFVSVEADPLAVGAKALEIYSQDSAAAVSSVLAVMVTPEYPTATQDVARAVPVLQSIGAPLPTKAQLAACKFMDELADSGAAEAVPHVLKAFYDDDLVEEEAMIGWSVASKNAKARDAASPFIEWLENAEEESD